MNKLFLVAYLFAHSFAFCQIFTSLEEYDLHVKNVDRSTFLYKYQKQYVENDEYKTREIAIEYDTSVYLLNEKNGYVFFEDYDSSKIRWYFNKDETINPVYTGRIALIGLDDEHIYMYSWFSGANVKIGSESLKTATIMGESTSTPFISSRSGLPPEYRERLYMIRHVKDKSFVATTTIDPSVDFVMNFLIISDQGWERTNYPKRSHLPLPQRNIDPLPTMIYELDLHGPFGFSMVDDEDKDIQSEYNSHPLPLDLIDYGVSGDLKVDSPFKIQELIDYSDYLDSYVFVGRVSRNGKIPTVEYNDAFWDGEDVLPVKQQNYDEYLFLVDKSGGKPKPILKIEEGHKVEDLLFSPEGQELVIEVDRDLYVLKFPDGISPQMIQRAQEGVSSLKEEELDPFLIEFLNKAGKEDLRRFRNSFFALMGYQFRSKELTEYFNYYPWYHPNSNVKANPELLTDKQRNLLNIIQNHERRFQ